MKHTNILRSLAVATLVAAAGAAQAQGIYVNKKDGQTVTYTSAILSHVQPIHVKTTVEETNYEEGVIATLKYEKLPDMNTPRKGHQLFPSGNGIVAVGGHTSNFQATATAELYQNGKWTNISISSAHDEGFAVTLADGRVLVGGGFSSAQGVGQTKATDIYNPATQTFTAGPQMTVARARASATATGGKVYVSGNWYANDKVMDYHNGSSFTAVGDMDGRSKPYVFYDNNGNIYSFSPLDIYGQDFGFYTSSDGEKALSGDRYEPSTGKTYYNRNYFFGEWALLPLTDDARTENSHYTDDNGNNCYGVLTKKDGKYLLAELSPDEGKTYTYGGLDIPVKHPVSGTDITWRSTVFVSQARQEYYLIGYSSQTNTLHILSYSFRTGYWTLASAGGFSGYDLMGASWTMTADGRLACTGGGNSNFSPNTSAFIFTLPEAGLTSSSEADEEYGVTVYKQDGTYDTYMEKELDSITTYDEASTETFDERITQDIPVEYLSKTSAYMSIYSGNTPPNIEGTYLMAPNKVVHDETRYYATGQIIAEMTFQFFNQDMTQNTLHYRERDASTSSSSDNVVLLGQGNDFTAYFIAEGVSDGITFKAAYLYSGTKQGDNIKNLYFALILLDKGDDPKGRIMDKGTLRVFRDGDSVTVPTSWIRQLYAPQRGINISSAISNTKIEE